MEHIGNTKDTIGTLCANSFWMDDRKQGEEDQMSSLILYGTEPVKVGYSTVQSKEMYFYQYLPIKMLGAEQWALPERLKHLEYLVGQCLMDFMFNYQDRNIDEQYVYLSAKSLFVPKGSNINRPGWHCDGFMSDDINYVWSDSLPTEYALESMELPQDHEECLKLLNEYEGFSPIECKPNYIYRMDETVIHRPKINEADPFLRNFVKVSFSEDQYNLIGNSHNYLFDYNWDMKDRNIERNHPSK